MSEYNFTADMLFIYGKCSRLWKSGSFKIMKVLRAEQEVINFFSTFIRMLLSVFI